MKLRRNKKPPTSKLQCQSDRSLKHGTVYKNFAMEIRKKHQEIVQNSLHKLLPPAAPEQELSFMELSSISKNVSSYQSLESSFDSEVLNKSRSEKTINQLKPKYLSPKKKPVGSSGRIPPLAILISNNKKLEQKIKEEEGKYNILKEKYEELSHKIELAETYADLPKYEAQGQIDFVLREIVGLKEKILMIEKTAKEVELKLH